MVPPNRSKNRNIFIFLFITIISTILFLTFVYLFGKILTKDISLEPVLPTSKPQSRVYLISYADGPAVHFKNQNALAVSAVNKGIDFILNYRRSHLDPLFVKQHASILNTPKGAGYWLWKPWIILHTLKTIPENSILIYLDTGVLLRKTITPLVELAKQHDIILLEYDPSKYWGKPINITKREIFLELDCDTKKCHYGAHIWAGVLILRNTKNSRDFINQWLKYSSDARLINDDIYIKQHTKFVKQYHDEAILNTLYNKNPANKYLLSSKIFFANYATWHHRCKGEYYSILMANNYNDDTLGYILQHHILNNYLSVWLREKLSNPLF